MPVTQTESLLSVRLYEVKSEIIELNLLRSRLFLADQAVRQPKFRVVSLATFIHLSNGFWAFPDYAGYFCWLLLMKLKSSNPRESFDGRCDSGGPCLRTVPAFFSIPTFLIRSACVYVIALLDHCYVV